MMKEFILGTMVSLVGAFDWAMGMEHYVVNPVNVIVKHYNAVTPQNTVESFKTSAAKLLRDLESSKAQYEDNDLLRTKWETGIAVLKDVFSMNHPSQSDLETLFARVCDITDNGFYDVSNAVITINPSKKDLKPLFENFWQHLLQAREIAAWWMCSDPRISIEDIPYLCFEACGLVKNPEANSILWSISILGGVSEAVQELDESGEPSESEILKAKKDAKVILESALKDDLLLDNSLRHFIETE